MPRRQKTLLWIFFPLLIVGAGVGAYRWRQAREREAHWQAMVVPPGGLAEQNGVPLSGQNTATNQASLEAPAANIVPGPTAVIEPVYLLWKETEWDGRLLAGVDGCLPISPDTDLVWEGNDIFLMKEPGRLEHLWSEQTQGEGVGSFSFFEPSGHRLCYDGRYIWLVAGGNAFHRVVVLDPSLRKSWEFGSEATGLFSGNVASAGVRLAPVRPGVVCGFFVDQNTWLALLHFNADDDRREVEMIDLPRTMTLERHPEQMFSLDATVAGQPVRRIVVGREHLPQLVLDPEIQQVSVAPANSSLVSFRTGHWCVHNGAIWWQRKAHHEDQHTTLMRAVLPDLKEQAVLSNVPSALLASHDGGLVLVGDECWQLKDGARELARINADYFWTFSDRLVPPSISVVSQVAPPAKVPGIDDLFRVPPEELAASGRGRYRPMKPYRSSVYGMLLQASSYSGGATYLYRFGVADSAEDTGRQRIAPASAAKPPAPTTIRVKLAAYAADPKQGSRLALVEASIEPEQIHWRQRLPVLAREIVRQSLLLAARTELGCAACDAALGESLPEGADISAEFLLSSWFRDDGLAEVSLQNVHEPDDSQEAWREELHLSNNDGLLDYPRLVKTAEGWSRDQFPQQLGLSLPDERRASDNAVDETAPGADAERELSEMTFPAQVAALRLCGRMAEDGASHESLGGLVRGYANLGLLTEHHWTHASKTFHARALLYAQRMVARSQESAWALWHRAYAEALAGLPKAALDDLAKADALSNPSDGAAASAPRPVWVDVIAAACRFDDEALATYSQDSQVGQLAALLHFLPLSRLPDSALAREAARDLLERQPECFRAYDAACDCSEAEELRNITATALEVARQRLPARLLKMPGLPASVAEQIDAASAYATEVERLATALIDMPGGELHELSWQALGALVRETLFQQCWRQAHLLRLQLGEESDEILSAAAPLVAHHPCRRLFDFYRSGRLDKLSDDQKSAADDLLERLTLSALSDAQFWIYDYFFGRAWRVHRPGQYVAAVSRPAEHRDDVFRDLLAKHDAGKRWRLLAVNGYLQPYVSGEFPGRPDEAAGTPRQLNAISPGNPEAIAAAVEVAPNIVLVEKVFDQLLDDHRRQPHVLRALANSPGQQSRPAQEALREYIRLSPDSWAYERLASFYLHEGKIDQWQAILDDYLAHRKDDDAAVSLRLGMANVFIDRGDWGKALPYAEAAARKNGEAAMACVIRCYQGVGEDEQEGVWHERIVERYPSARNAREYYLWSRRSGLGDAEVLADRAFSRIGPEKDFAPPNDQIRYAAFFWLARRYDDAIHAYQLAASMAQDSMTPAFCKACIALIAQERGDGAARDTMLEELAALGGPQTEPYRKLASWLAAGVTNKKLDAQLAEQITTSAQAFDQPALNYLFGYALLLARQTQDAVPLLERAATLRQGAGATSRAMAAAVLRDRGLIPGKLNQAIE